MGSHGQAARHRPPHPPGTHSPRPRHTRHLLQRVPDMLPELGHFALILALLLAGLQAFFGIAGPMLGRDRWIAAVTPAVAGQFVMIATAMGCLITAFVAL